MLYFIGVCLIIFNIVCNCYVLNDVWNEKMSWQEYVNEAQSYKIGRFLMKTYYWLPTLIS